MVSKRQAIVFWLVAALVTAVGCGGEEEASDEGAGDVIIATEAAGEEACEHGGTIIRVGTDQSGDGDIDDEGDIVIVCDGQPGATGDTGESGEQGMTGETGEPGEPGAPGDHGQDGEDGIDGADAACAHAEPVEIEASLEAANYYRSGQSYALTVATGATELHLEVFGGAEVDAFVEVDSDFVTEITFGQEELLELLIVATDGCHLAIERLEVEVYPPPYVKLDAGFFHTCGLRADGAITCWGIDESLSLGEQELDIAPLIVAPEGDDFIDLSAGFGSTCGKHADGTLSCRFALLDGESGGETPAGTFETLSADGAVCGLRSPQTAYCLALNEGGEVEAADIFSDHSDPRFASVGFYMLDLFGIGGRYVIVLEDGDAYSITLFGDSPTPSPLLEGETFQHTDIAMGAFCGVSADEYLMCQLATGEVDEPDDLTLDYVSEKVGAQRTSAGLAHGCAIFDDGTIGCIGEVFDTFGDEMLSAGDLEETVFDVPDDNNFVDVASGLLHVCGLTDDDEVICWGDVNIEGVQYPEATEPIP